MKRKLLLLILPIIPSVILSAQEVNEVVSAELSFANTAKTQSMKKAFLAFMDSSAVVFEAGTIHNGFAFWNNTGESKGKLLWHPSFFGMSHSNDMGFTTGPWEYRPTLNDSIAGSGQYTTVWIKNKKGEWKFLVDLGVGYRGSLYADSTLRSCPALVPGDASDTSGVFEIENNFLREFGMNGPSVFGQFLHPNSWLNTDGKHPLQTARVILNELSKLPPETTFQPVSGGMASSRDLAYVYGIVTYKSKKENYLRVWGNTERGWEIVLQVIKR